MISFTSSDSQLRFALLELKFENHEIINDISRFRWVAGLIPLEVTTQTRDDIVFSRSYGVLVEVIITRTAPADSCFKESS